MSPRSPLDGIELVLIDGNNLLHRRRQGLGDAALRGLIVELQRLLPAGVRAEVILDGHATAGTPMRQKISPALELRHAGGAADEAIVAAIAAPAVGEPRPDHRRDRRPCAGRPITQRRCPAPPPRLARRAAACSITPGRQAWQFDRRGPSSPPAQRQMTRPSSAVGLRAAAARSRRVAARGAPPSLAA